MASKIKKGDTVQVITGKDKGKVGAVTKVFRDDRVTVSGINLKKKTVKADSQNNVAGEIKTIEGRIHVSNVVLYDAESKKPIKVGFKVVEGKSVRVDKATGEAV